jgi:S1-C subfamily serine protease
MSGPKHLWSGDWEDESARAAAQRRPALPEAPEPAPPAPEPELAAPANRTPPIRFAGVIVALVLVVGVVLAATLGGSSKKHNHTGTSTVAATPTGTGPNGGAGIQTNPPIQTTPIINLPSADWLGMQIVTSSTGAVISNVQLGSPGDEDGFEPGDGINTIDGRQIDSVTQIRSATAKLKLGSQLRVQVERGSTPITLVLTMRKRPTISP